MVLLCATCFYVEVVILGDRFKYDEVSALLESVNDLFASCVLSEPLVIKKSYRVSFEHYLVVIVKMKNI